MDALAEQSEPGNVSPPDLLQLLLVRQTVLARLPNRCRFRARAPSPLSHWITPFGGHPVDRGSGALGAMGEDARSKAERYRSAANKYGEMAKQAEPEYLAAVFRKVAVQYVYMAEDALRAAERRRSFSQMRPYGDLEHAKSRC